MLVIFPVCGKDANRLRDLIVWIRQLGGCNGHHAVIVSDPHTAASSILDIKDQATCSFDSVDMAVADRHQDTWITGANELFLRSALYASQRGMPWIFLEPDAVPLKPGWLDTIEIHYRCTGAQYLGRLVPCDKPGLPSIHFTGVGVYPATAYHELRAYIHGRPSVAFDLSTAEYLNTRATNSILFQHLWGEMNKPPVFSESPSPSNGVFGLDYLQHKAVLFHRNKDGSLIRLLRRQYGIKGRAFIQLGRFGDIILLLPALRYISQVDGCNPSLICSTDYASVLEGVSYVDPVPLPVSWFHGMGDAIEYGHKHFGSATVLQCHALNWGVDIKRWPNFMTSMWDRTGVPVQLIRSLPLIFDQRSKEREAQQQFGLNGKPFIVVNTHGVSSPFRHRQTLYSALSHLKPKIDILEIGTVHCHRIYDLLSLMDRAIGGIHIDTATLHLAHACPKPYIGLTVDGWCSSIPRGNCVMEVKYSAFTQYLYQMVHTVEQWL